MKKKIIVFDMDGVLFDTNELVQKSMLDLYPGLTSQMQKDILLDNFHDGIEKLPVPKKDETQEEKEGRQQKYSEQKACMPFFDGMRELLVCLHTEGYILTINTSALDRNCFPLLENSGVQSLFDCVVTASLVRSKTDKFKIIHQKYGGDLQEMIFITDTVGDIREAHAYGIETIAVTWGVHDRNYFTREHFDNIVAIVDTVEELESWIKK